VLVVEDHHDTLDLWTYTLEDYGAEVISASSAAEALASLQRHRPAVVVSDVRMLGNGHKIATKASELGVPVIAVTGTQAEAIAVGDGFVHHLLKPVEPEQLCAVIEKVLRDHQPSRAN
jgi:CheY-like chemotaxis protein